jgi:hypothetical protein
LAPLGDGLTDGLPDVGMPVVPPENESTDVAVAVAVVLVEEVLVGVDVAAVPTNVVLPARLSKLVAAEGVGRSRVSDRLSK